MGRPINKKYFGNTNEGVITPSVDNGIGGEGVASVTITDPGSYDGELPTVEFPVPSIPDGVKATGVVHGKVVSNDGFDVAGTGYNLGNVITVSGGTFSTAATLTITGVQTVGTPTLTAAGIMYDVSGGTKDEIWFDSAGWDTPLKIRVDTVTGGNGVATFTVLQQGVWTGPGAAPTSVTGTSTHNGPIDSNGTGATFTLTWGAYSANTTAEGDYTVVPSNPVATTGAGNNAAKITLHWGVKSVAITENGSGYISPTDAQPTFSSPIVVSVGTGTATGDAVLEETQQNAIVGIDLSTGNVVDIIKQESSSSYWVETTTGPMLLNLADSTQSNGLYILAVDSDGGTYWIKNIKSHRVTLGTEGGTGTQFSEDETTTWTFDTPVAGVSVLIRNAA